MNPAPFILAITLASLGASNLWAGDAAAPRALARPGDGTYEEELARADERVAARPGEARGWYERSYLRFLQGEWNRSLADCDRAEELAPDAFATGWVRGQVLAAAGDSAAGEAALSAFLDHHPDHAAAWAARARVRLGLGRMEEAFADFRMALSLDRPIEAGLYLEIASAYEAHGHPAEAARLLSDGLLALDDSTLLLPKALELALVTCDYATALKRIDALQSCAPEPAPWMARRAEVLTLAGRPDEARHAWRALLAHIEALPNLQRGHALLQSLAREAREALAAADRLSLISAHTALPTIP